MSLAILKQRRFYLLIVGFSVFFQGIRYLPKKATEAICTAWETLRDEYVVPHLPMSSPADDAKQAAFTDPEALVRRVDNALCAAETRKKSFVASLPSSAGAAVAVALLYCSLVPPRPPSRPPPPQPNCLTLKEIL